MTFDELERAFASNETAKKINRLSLFRSTRAIRVDDDTFVIRYKDHNLITLYRNEIAKINLDFGNHRSRGFRIGARQKIVWLAPFPRTNIYSANDPQGELIQ